MRGTREARLAAIVAGAAGGLYGLVHGLLSEQGRRARQAIGTPLVAPLRADGTYLADGSGPLLDPPTLTDDPLTFAILGDSLSAGLGVERPAELLGVRLARGLADETARPVVLTTHAVVGATTDDLAAQVDRTLRHSAPALTLILVGANDITSKRPIRASARLLGEQVSRLREVGAEVVVGTCPDLGTIRPIPQPLRWVARSRSRSLARAQREVVSRTAGHPVPLADLLAPEFLSKPAEFFSTDNFHPSAAGYEATATVLLPVLCDAVGSWGAPIPEPPSRSAVSEARRPTSRIVARLNQYLRGDQPERR